MKNNLTKYLSILFLLIASSNFYGCGYNKLVTLEESVNSAWSQVEKSVSEKSGSYTKSCQYSSGFS